MQSENQYGDLEEVDYYREKFVSLGKVIASKPGKSAINTQAQEILKDRSWIQRNSNPTQSNPTQSNPVRTGPTEPQQQSSAALQSFFIEKRSRIAPSETGFRSLLEHPPVSPRTFKKRAGNSDEMTRLNGENRELRRRLEGSKMGVGNTSTLELEVRKQEERIQQLQDQNTKLSRDNSKLRSERSVTATQSGELPTPPEAYLYNPYFIVPRENDLQKISVRTLSEGTLSRGQPQDMDEFGLPFFGNNMVQLNRNYETASDMADVEPAKDRFSVFDMSRSSYSEYLPQDDNSFKGIRGAGVEDPRTALRNKIAFFRNSGVIVRDQDFEIAYKRS
jgi:hypothetical protein